MGVAALLDAITGANINGIRLALRSRRLAREYLSQSVQRFDELIGNGLEPRDPIGFLYERGWAVRHPAARVELPVALETPGGTRLDELLVLAAVTRVLQPRKVFEIGTFMGRTTSVFVLNAPADASIVSMDLPLDVDVGRDAPAYLETDVDLVRQRRVGSFLRELDLAHRCQQILCDSLAFDPAPHAGSVELGFIDGAHTLRHVKNDTEKMASMAGPRGLVLWHDYGGKGQFRDLTRYLDDLARTIRIFRVPRTTLAWAPADALRTIAR